MQGLINFLSEFVNWIFALILAVVKTLVNMLQDMVLWVFDQLGHAVTFLLGLLDFDFMESTTFQDAVNNLPPQVLNVFYILGLPYCLGLIVSAIFIRLFMQLIPFTRLGS